MDSLPDRTDAADSRTPARAPKGGKVQRIASHTQGLVEDLREWIDLRVDLAILEVEEKVDTLQNTIALVVVLAILGFFAGLFGLTTLALGIGWVTGHPFWGFLTVFVLLVVGLIGLRAARPDLVPPSNLFRSIRGDRSRPNDEDDRPAREAKATVSDAPGSSPNSGAQSANDTSASA